MTTFDPPAAASLPHMWKEDEIELLEYWYIFLNHKWQIICIMLLILGAAAAYVMIARPVYVTSAMLQLEEKGEGSLEDISRLLGDEGIEALAQLDIIRSRSVIGQMVDELKLHISVTPNYFPVIGEFIARQNKHSETPAKPLWKLDQFAWGGERIKIDMLEAVPAYQDMPFKLIAGGQGRYRLYTNDGKLLTEGMAGKTALAEIDGHPVLTLLVSELHARPNTVFTLMHQHRNQVIKQYQGRIQAAEKRIDTGILEISIEGSDPYHIEKVVNTLIQIYIDKHIERKTQELEQMLTFVNSQLPSLKSKLNAAENVLKSHHQKYGSIDIDLETQTLLAKVSNVEKQISELELISVDYKRKYTPSHPRRVTLEKKINQLQGERGEINRRIKSLPEAKMDALQVMRDFTTASDVYTMLLTKAQELSIARAGIVGSVYVVDRGIVPRKPIKPQKTLIIGMAVLFGFFMGGTIVLMRKFFNTGIDSPDMIEQNLDLSVYALIPHSKQQMRLSRMAKQKKHDGARNLLAEHFSQDQAIESLRSLRTTLQFSLLETDRPVISILGPAPDAGKSFVAANLTFILTEAQKRVILVDADLRRGRLHHTLGENRSPGLTEFIQEGIDYKDIIRKVHLDRDNQDLQFDFIPNGITPSNPAELLMTKQFQDLITRLGQEYDLVLLDTPPVIAVTDAAIIGRLSGVNLVVIQAGRLCMEDLKFSLKRLHQGGVNVHGAVLNNILPKHSSHNGYRYYYKYYTY